MIVHHLMLTIAKTTLEKMEGLLHQRKNAVLILLKQRQNFAWVYIVMLIIVCLFVNGKEITKIKANNKNVNFLIRFCLGSISYGFSTTESREVSLNGNVYEFSVDNNSVDKSDMLNIRKYLMT